MKGERYRLMFLSPCSGKICMSKTSIRCNDVLGHLSLKVTMSKSPVMLKGDWHLPHHLTCTRIQIKAEFEYDRT